MCQSSGCSPPLLGQVGPGPLRAEKMGLLGDVVTRSGDPFGADIPVDGADKLSVAVSAAVRDIYCPPLVFESRAGAEDFGRLLADRPPGKENDDEQDRCEDDHAAEDQKLDGHVHWASSFVLVP